MAPMSRLGDEPNARSGSGLPHDDECSNEPLAGKIKPPPIIAEHGAADAAMANALRDSLLAVTSLPCVDEMMEQILDSVGSVIPYEGATILIFQGDRARVAYARGFDAEVQSSILRAFLPATKTHFQQLRETGAPYIVDDALLDPDWIEMPGTEWIRSTIGVPITVNDRTIGLIAIDSSVPNHFTAADAARMQLFARYVGLAINNAYQNELLGRLVADRTAALQRANQELEAKEAMLRSAQHIAQLGSWFINMTTGELHWSDELFAIGGFDMTAGIPDLQTIVRHVHPSDLARFEELIEKLKGASGPAEAEITFIRASDSVERKVLLRAEPIGLPEAVTYVQGIALDITDQKAAEAALRRALEHEKDVSALKSRFAAMASHEFRSPLGVILANAELLKMGWRTLSAEKVETRLDNILNQANLLNDILRRLLELSQLQAGSVAFSQVRLDLVNVCREALVQLRNATESDVAIQFNTPPAPVWVTGDPVYLHRIVSNIIGNAQKYSPVGAPIHITFASDGNHACLCVADHGIGIPPADLASIFEPFYRGANVHGIPGSGLGMALVKLLVDLHRGRIHVESEVGLGTRVTVHLPCAEPVSPL